MERARTRMYERFKLSCRRRREDLTTRTVRTKLGYEAPASTEKTKIVLVRQFHVLNSTSALSKLPALSAANAPSPSCCRQMIDSHIPATKMLQ